MVSFVANTAGFMMMHYCTEVSRIVGYDLSTYDIRKSAKLNGGISLLFIS